MADDPSKRIETKLSIAVAIIAILGFFGIANWHALIHHFFPGPSPGSATSAQAPIARAPITETTPANPSLARSLARTRLMVSPGCDLTVSGYLVTEKALVLKARNDGSQAAINDLANHDSSAAQEAISSGNAESGRRLQQFAAKLDTDATKAANLSIQYDLASLAGDLRREAQNVTDDNQPAVDTDESQFSTDEQQLSHDCGFN
ncbi:MAG: hypothetical protein ACRDQ4_09295 [Pseudonocardiaceae bacterium]